MFPTLFTVTSIGMSNIASKLAVIFAPIAAELDPKDALLIFTTLTVATAFVSLNLKAKSDLKIE